MNRAFRAFCFCDFDLVTFIYELDLYPLKTYMPTKVNFVGKAFKSLSYYIHAATETIALLW